MSTPNVGTAFASGSREVRIGWPRQVLLGASSTSTRSAGSPGTTAEPTRRRAAHRSGHTERRPGAETAARRNIRLGWYARQDQWESKCLRVPSGEMDTDFFANPDYVGSFLLVSNSDRPPQ